MAELLISLAILGVIATFTVPKILQAQQNERLNAITKEAVSTISAAYRQQQLNGQASIATSMGSLWTEMNYVKVDTTTYLSGSNQCDGLGHTCILLHNGAYLYPHINSFDSTSPSQVIGVSVYPNGADGGVTPNTNFYMYYNGRIVSSADVDAGTMYGASPVSQVATPGYFHW